MGASATKSVKRLLTLSLSNSGRPCEQKKNSMSDVPVADRPTLIKRLLQILRGEDASDAAAMRESLEEVIEESERQSPALSKRRNG